MSGPQGSKVGPGSGVIHALPRSGHARQLEARGDGIEASVARRAQTLLELSLKLPTIARISITRGKEQEADAKHAKPLAKLLLALE
jgi:hypothetical protein